MLVPGAPVPLSRSLSTLQSPLPSNCQCSHKCLNRCPNTRACLPALQVSFVNSLSLSTFYPRFTCGQLVRHCYRAEGSWPDVQLKRQARQTMRTINEPERRSRKGSRSFPLHSRQQIVRVQVERVQEASWSTGRYCLLLTFYLKYID